MVCLGDDLAAGERKRIVGLTAFHIGDGKARAKFNALDGGDGEHGVRKQALHGVKPGLAHACGHAGDGGFQNAAHAVAVLCGLKYLFLHFFFDVGRKNRKILLGNGLEFLHAIIDKDYKVDEPLALGDGEIFTQKFPNGKFLLCERSPHITMGNLLMAPLFGVIADYISVKLFPVYLVILLSVMVIMHIQLKKKIT